MNADTQVSPHWLHPRELSAELFAPFGQIVRPIRTAGQAAPGGASHIAAQEADLVLAGGVPRIWIMQLSEVGLRFSTIARHRRVTQCLGSIDGKEWFISVAPPGDPADSARPGIEDIVAFRVPANVIVKLHVGTWHAGPHFVGNTGSFVNLEHADTNQNDNQSVEIGVECRYRIE